MFNTSIHCTTFFYLIVDTFIVLFVFSQSTRLKHTNLNRYLFLGTLFVAYNLTGGFLPIENFPGPFILQYLITYGVAITMCLYLVYYLYKEFDIVFLRTHFTIRRITIFIILCFIGLFLLPYFLTDSLDMARAFFTIPVSIICLYFTLAFYRRISNPKSANQFILRRNRFALISITCISLLPLLTLVGDYQWLTFSVVNLAFYAITGIEIDRYLYFLENKGKLAGVFDSKKKIKGSVFELKFLNKDLTRREIEIALFILESKSYRQIGEDLFIAENTVSKHASNIFKKLHVKNRAVFLKDYKQN